MKLEKNLKSALRKAKMKQFILLLGTTIISLMLLSIIIYRTCNYFAHQQTMTLYQELERQEVIASPNIRNDSQVLSGNSMLGGDVITTSSKNINGYIIPWDISTSSYSLSGHDLGSNNFSTASSQVGENTYFYNSQTKQKVATFYHPEVNNYRGGLSDEAVYLAEMDNQVAEVALSFDQAYTISEVKEMLPDNLNLVWFYVAGVPAYMLEDNAPAQGNWTYGFHYEEELAVHKLASFLNYLQEVEEKDVQDYLQQTEVMDFQEEYEIDEEANEPSEPGEAVLAALAKVKVLGVMVTGTTENLSALADIPEIRASSIGATAEIVPYIQPTKE